MTIRVGNLNGKNLNYLDQDNSALDYALVNSGIIEGLQVSANTVWVGRAILITKRTSVTPNQKFGVHIEIVANETIDTAGTKKVWIALDPQYINDGTLATNSNGVWIGTIQTGSAYPTDSAYYLPLASISSWTITDDRVMISLKPLTTKWVPTDTVFIGDWSWNGVYSQTLPSAVLANIASSSQIANAASTAGKYITSAPLGESISGTTPTPMSIVSGAIAYTDTLGSNIIGTTRLKSGKLYSVPYAITVWSVTFAQNCTSTSGRVHIIDASGNILATQTPTVGSNTVDFAQYAISANTAFGIVCNDIVNFNNVANEQTLAQAQVNCQFVTWGTANGTSGNPQFITSVSFGSLKAMRSNTSSYEYSNFAGFIVWPKNKWDMVSLNGNNGTVVSGFTGLTLNQEFYLSATSGVLSSTVWALYSRIGRAISTTDFLIDKEIEVARSTASGNNYYSGIFTVYSTTITPTHDFVAMLFGIVWTTAWNSAIQFDWSDVFQSSVPSNGSFTPKIRILWRAWTAVRARTYEPNNWASSSTVIICKTF